MVKAEAQDGVAKGKFVIERQASMATLQMREREREREKDLEWKGGGRKGKRGILPSRATFCLNGPSPLQKWTIV